MEKSKKNLANTMLYYVIILSIIAIIAVTLFTASKKEEPHKNPEVTIDSTKIDTKTNESEKKTETINSEKQTKPKDTVKSTEKVGSESKSETTSSNSTKTDVPAKVTYQAPVNGYLAKEYEIDVPVYSITMNDYRAHTGIDLACSEGSPVSSCADGVIKSVSNHPMMGTTVVVEHSDGVTSYYMNLNETLPEDITVGTNVKKGQLLGAVGNTALTEIAQEPHLHFEMTVSGAYVDPLSILDNSTISVMGDNVIE